MTTPPIIRDRLCGTCNERPAKWSSGRWRPCAPCNAARVRGRYQADEAYRRRRNLEGAVYKHRHAERLSAQQKAQRRAERLELFERYGGASCACCGEAEFAFLTIDHIAGNGAQHRGGRSVDLQKLLRRQGYPLGFQVLCWNCNSGRHQNGGICPHQVAIKVGV